MLLLQKKLSSQLKVYWKYIAYVFVILCWTHGHDVSLVKAVKWWPTSGQHEKPIAGDFNHHASVLSVTSSGISYPNMKFCFLMSWCELDRCTIWAPKWMPPSHWIYNWCNTNVIFKDVYQLKKTYGSILIKIISHHLSRVNVAHWLYGHNLTQKKWITTTICYADANALPGKPCLPCTKWKCANGRRTEFLFSHNMNMQAGKTVWLKQEALVSPHRKSWWPRYWIL